MPFHGRRLGPVRPAIVPAPGIGKRLDGWPNRDLDPGAIIALSSSIDTATRAVFSSWGKGKYDPRFNLDGINGPVVIPPAYGLDGVARITSTGDGDDIAYWNRYVAVTQMGGHGAFSDARIGVDVRNGSDDLVSAKLPALQAYNAKRSLGLGVAEVADLVEYLKSL